MTRLVKTIKLNNLQYNPNRDPRVYSRSAGETFRIQASLDGEGTARVQLVDGAGHRLSEASVSLPGMFSQELRYPTPGSRTVTLIVESGGERVVHELKLEVVDQALAAA